MGPLASVVAVLNALMQMLTASLLVVAFDRYGDARIAGGLFAAFGLGGLTGTLLAYQLVKRMEPIVMASLAALGFALPLWVLVARVPLAPIAAHGRLEGAHDRRIRVACRRLVGVPVPAD